MTVWTIRQAKVSRDNLVKLVFSRKLAREILNDPRTIGLPSDTHLDAIEMVVAETMDPSDASQWEEMMTNYEMFPQSPTEAPALLK